MISIAQTFLGATAVGTVISMATTTAPKRKRSQGPTNTLPTRASKRKRVQVSYLEIDSEVDYSDEGDDIVEYSPPKNPGRPVPKHKIFPFLQLPAEIRNEIYMYALHEPVGIILQPSYKKYRRGVTRVTPEDQAHYRNDDRMFEWALNPSRLSENERTSLLKECAQLCPSLLAVNHQVYNEACKVLYGNRFLIPSPMALHSFMVGIGPRAAALIKHITMLAWGGRWGMRKAYNHACWAVLAMATNLERFYINAVLPCRTKDPKWVARAVYRDGFPFFEAIGLARGRYDAAIDVVELSTRNFVRHGWDEEWNYNKEMEEFREELRALLKGHINYIRSRLKKRDEIIGPKKTDKNSEKFGREMEEDSDDDGIIPRIWGGDDDDDMGNNVIEDMEDDDDDEDEDGDPIFPSRWRRMANRR